jgi:hypothetical protein
MPPNEEQTPPYVQLGPNRQDQARLALLGRDFRLSPAAISKWMQAGRMSLPWVGPGYAQLPAEQMPGLGAIQERSRLIEEEIDVRLVLVLVDWHDWWVPNSHATSLFVAPVFI